MRIALPIVSATTVPTPAFEQYVLQQLPLGGKDSITGSTYAPAPQVVSFCQKMFGLTAIRAGSRSRFWAALSIATAAGQPVRPRTVMAAPIARASLIPATDREQVQTARIDYNIDDKNTTWYRFQSDTGLQAAYTDPINPLFNSVSPQPLYSFAAGYTHVFSSKLVNYFNPAVSTSKPLGGSIWS